MQPPPACEERKNHRAHEVRGPSGVGKRRKTTGGEIRKDPVPEGQDALLNEVWTLSLFEALFGRRARRFAYGMEIPHGPLAFK